MQIEKIFLIYFVFFCLIRQNENGKTKTVRNFFLKY